jgi:hypothetical protein
MGDLVIKGGHGLVTKDMTWAENFFRKLKNFQEAEKYFRLRPKNKSQP